MRQNGPQRRGRGRNNGRRSQNNALNRNYESNGPDVKIRGTAAHVAEKYAALARDASVAGDRIAAENYLQHAEHYNRIVAAIAEQAAERQAAEQERRDRNRPNRQKEAADGSENEATVAAGDDAPLEAQSASVEEGQSADIVDIASCGEKSKESEAPVEASEAKPKRRPRKRVEKVEAVDESGSDDSPSDGSEGNEAAA